MLSRRNAIVVAIASLIGAATPALARTKKPNPVTRFDTDKDGTLDIKELQGRLSLQEFAAADPDKDKTLTRDEYLMVVEQRFKSADTDNDGTVSASEIQTPAGHALGRLLG